MRKTISILATSLCLLISQSFMPCQANNKVQTHTTVTRSYNSNWQAEIINKHPNANHFYWTPMTITKAKAVKYCSPAKTRSTYRNRKPVVVAWTSYSTPKKQTSAAVNLETSNTQCTPVLSYGSTNASLYGSPNLSGHLNSQQVNGRIYSKETK